MFNFSYYINTVRGMKKGWNFGWLIIIIESIVGGLIRRGFPVRKIPLFLKVFIGEADKNLSMIEE